MSLTNDTNDKIVKLRLEDETVKSVSIFSHTDMITAKENLNSQGNITVELQLHEACFDSNLQIDKNSATIYGFILWELVKYNNVIDKENTIMKQESSGSNFGTVIVNLFTSAGLKSGSPENFETSFNDIYACIDKEDSSQHARNVRQFVRDFFMCLAMGRKIRLKKQSKKIKVALRRAEVPTTN